MQPRLAKAMFVFFIVLLGGAALMIELPHAVQRHPQLEKRTLVQPQHQVKWALRDTLNASNQSCGDLPQDRQPSRRATFLGHTKVDSTLRYLGVELEDALSIAERIDI